ncbi:MAG TPA: decarboxylating 6-phosphogluconate dehydrogenase [Candidatus Eisenbacteria bacterium]|jgi:6-phosphogluconate dehydrogenase
MDIGFVGLGRMGLNMTIRLARARHRVVAWNRTPDKVAEARAHGADGAASLEALVQALAPPRAIWAMIPAGKPVDDLIEALLPRLSRGDLVVDGGNSNFRDSKRRAERLRPAGIEFVDAGVSGGIWGLELGYCMMLGGEPASIARLTPALDSLAPRDGWRHLGGAGAGHFAKMIHNGIEYGMMQAYAEGFEILKASEYRYDLAALAHLWNQGSVVRSWLLELAERAFEKDPGLDRIRGYVEDSGEGRWTVLEAIDKSVPAPVLALSLFRRFRSRQEDAFSDRVLAALRAEFGGHAVKEKA